VSAHRATYRNDRGRRGRAGTVWAVSRWVRLRGVAAVVTALGACLAAGAPAGARPVVGRPVALLSGSVRLGFTARAFAALTASSSGQYADTRSVTAVAPSAGRGGGAFALPITRGRVNAAALTGSARTGGGLDFAQDNQNPQYTSHSQFSLVSFVLDLSSTPAELTATFIGSQTNRGTVIAMLSTRGVRHAVHGTAVTISGLTMKLTGTGAQVLNLQASGFRIGETIGTVSLSARS
jgi:hypothetical protein